MTDFKNPPQRLPLRADFPAAPGYKAIEKRASWVELKPALAILERELQKRGKTLETAGRIVVAYPHKTPHSQARIYYAEEFFQHIRAAVPQVEWVAADGLYETVHLCRSEKQDMIHTLTARQAFAYNAAVQEKPLRFRDELFIIVDDCIIQGTTVAEMTSAITHNGGHVLMALQVRAPAHSRLALSDDRLPALSHVFSMMSEKNLTPTQCLNALNEELKPYGNSVGALTDEEARRLALHASVAPPFETLLGTLRRMKR